MAIAAVGAGCTPSPTALSSTASPTPVATGTKATGSPIATPLSKTSDPVTTVIRCGTLAPNSVPAGHGAGPDTYELRSPTGVIVARFLWPVRQSPLGAYLCARLIAGAPMAGLDALIRPGEPDYVAEPTAASLPAPASVADQVTVNGRAYRIAPESPSLWRDFMPISPPGGRPLAASIRVVAVDGGSFPLDITVDRVWVNGPSVWEVVPEVRRSPEAGMPPSQIEVFASEGPKWEPGIEVDVVIRLVSAGASYFLGASGVEIQRGS